MIFVDGGYTNEAGHNEIYTIELDQLDWDDVNYCIGEIFKWEEAADQYINFIEVWESDNDDFLAHYTRKEALDIANPIMKNCRSIWRIK